MWRAEMAKRGVPGDKILNDAEAMVEALNEGPIPKYWTHEELVKELKF